MLLSRSMDMLKGVGKCIGNYIKNHNAQNTSNSQVERPKSYSANILAKPKRPVTAKSVAANLSSPTVSIMAGPENSSCS